MSSRHCAGDGERGIVGVVLTPFKHHPGSFGEMRNIPKILEEHLGLKEVAGKLLQLEARESALRTEEESGLWTGVNQDLMSNDEKVESNGSEAVGVIHHGERYQYHDSRTQKTRPMSAERRNFCRELRSALKKHNVESSAERGFRRATDDVCKYYPNVPRGAVEGELRRTLRTQRYEQKSGELLASATLIRRQDSKVTVRLTSITEAGRRHPAIGDLQVPIDHEVDLDVYNVLVEET
ncbi:hypothetical protein Bbelb_283070 [Branchiostoma belcheri]|nr:hypothetical protein Bbelb_283070 [Branchiostoma belcheri]